MMLGFLIGAGLGLCVGALVFAMALPVPKPRRRVLRDGKLVCLSCGDAHSRPLEALIAMCDCEFREVTDNCRTEFNKLVTPEPYEPRDPPKGGMPDAPGVFDLGIRKLYPPDPGVQVWVEFRCGCWIGVVTVPAVCAPGLHNQLKPQRPDATCPAHVGGVA